ncbi:Spy/CpxP family protein refolding chaperone [Pseudomonas nitroreducens]|uniref:Spy/CpxP family protein refolding chaperone n=1 Tax=Pseudomonas nitroreducens TaxID=46680 RepID=UPI00209CC983|nr:Spy/CpxP family protein refolding chaperone [Pseudomonas nitroreducens]MCP1622262.1 Spy/CpxP family protein refolding chaperone [Pseudomonas nitroreducens]
MRKTLTALLIAAALPTVALAATPAPTDAPPPAPFMKDHGPGMHGPRGEHGGMFRELNLTQDQRQQVGKLMGDSMKDRRAITEKYWNKLPEADRKAMQEELKANRDKSEASIRGILTPEQQKKFDELKKQREQRKAEWAEFQTWKAQKDGTKTN